MRICRLNFILLTSISLISGKLKFYFIDDDGKRIETETFEGLPYSNIKKLVVDFGSTFYLANVVDSLGDGTLLTPVYY